MYPGRFLKADMFKGKKITLTIKDIEGDELIGENNKAKQEWLVKFNERPLEFVLNKTNAFCLYRMYGGDPHSWIGKRITMYPTKTKFGRNDVDCIRIWGSPDIVEDLEISVPQGRKKAWETILHAVKAANGKAPESVSLDPRILTAWELLGWTKEEGNAHRTKGSLPDGEYLKDLNAHIDAMNQSEIA
jgi:hypothetical protein